MNPVLNKVSNVFVKPILRSPAHPLVSRHLMLIIFTGRTSGKVYSTPVEYQQHDHTVSFMTHKDRKWWKNFEGGAPVTLKLRGKTVEGTATPHQYDTDRIIRLLRKRYPAMNEKQLAKMAPNMIVVTVHLKYV